MKHTFPRDFYLPKSQTLVPVNCAGTDAAIWTYDDNGRFCAIGFHGKAAKPDFHSFFGNAERRTKYIEGYLDGRKSYAATLIERKAKRKAPHTLKVGDILVCSWGYDQTNIDYYQVTRVPGPSTVEICEIVAKSGPEIGFMTANCTADRDNFKGEPMIKRASSENSVQIESYAWASPWDGKEDRYSWYA